MIATPQELRWYGDAGHLTLGATDLTLQTADQFGYTETLPPFLRLGAALGRYVTVRNTSGGLYSLRLPRGTTAAQDSRPGAFVRMVHVDAASPQGVAVEDSAGNPILTAAPGVVCVFHLMSDAGEGVWHVALYANLAPPVP